MNFRFTKRNTAPADENAAAGIGKNLGLHPKTAELLFSRGFCDEQSIRKFLTPEKNDFYDPFLMKGMTEAVKRIEEAVNRRENVIVYGDYDADGVCAAAIITLYLVARGLKVLPHIPSRSGEGYGLSVETLERLIETAEPGLIITCDCGISGNAEVSHCLDLGVDIIVTDHHEVSEEGPPECIVINPKQADCAYPVKNLCGAGVALKLVMALGGAEAAMQYVDLAALATVADLVPLLDENRLIVQLGLKSENLRSPGLIALLKDQELLFGFSSSDIAYKIAPRINAAGRMGDAYRAFELLTIADAQRIAEIIAEINADNLKRKALSEEMYEEAVAVLRNDDLTDARAVVLSHKSWEKGITGILAARIAGEYKRPAFIMVNAGAHYKGTCRSFGNINIYQLLGFCFDLLLEFGGHSQAAGFSIVEENIGAFKKRVNELLTLISDDYFLPALEYDIDIREEDICLEFAKDLERFEPVGNSNPRPVFRCVAQELSTAPCKSNYRHTSITLQSGLTVLAFNHYPQNQFLWGDAQKELALEISVSTFGKKESVKAVLKGVAPEKLYIDDEIARANYFKNISMKKISEPVYEFYAPSRLAELIDHKLYGTLFIAGCADTYHKFIGKHAPKYLHHEFMYSTIGNNLTRITVSPIFDGALDLANYGKIIFLDSPVGTGLIPYLNRYTRAKIFLPVTNNEAEFFKGVDLSRAAFGRYYELLKRNAGLKSVNVFDYFRALKSGNPDITATGLIAALAVFNELKLISFQKEGFGITIHHGVKAELNHSAVFRYLS